jgi:hypothetical protein
VFTLSRLLVALQEAVVPFNSRTKVDAVRQKVESVKETMSQNIDKARA